MPSLDATEEECIADFTIRKDTRLDFPGACSLNFEGELYNLIILHLIKLFGEDFFFYRRP